MNAVEPALLSVVLPVYNENLVIERLIQEIDAAAYGNVLRHEIIFVDDGSTDGTAETLDRLAQSHRHVRALHLSRNFGQQAALLAGLQEARGDVVVVMDADMQDDPRAIGPFLTEWRKGAQVVYAVRVRRKENALLRFLFVAFYRILNSISKTPIPPDAGNFCLVDRRVVEEIVRLLGQDRYFPGVRRWVGYKQVGVTVERHARYDGQPRVRLLGLWELAKTAIFSFSTFPLTVFYMIATASMTVFVGLWGFTLYHRLFTGLAIPGWTSQMMVACFFGAINSLGIGIVGEYVARIYEQVRQRPPYIVQKRVNFAEEESELPLD